MNVIMDVLLLPMVEYVYPKAVTIALAITTVLIFGGLAGVLASYFIGALLDKDTWNITIIAFGITMIGLTILLVLIPIMMFTGVRA